MLATIRSCFALVFLFALAACARHYTGRVVDEHGRPVPYARVEGSGMHGGMITGEGPFTVDTVADADGKFTLVTRTGRATLRRLLPIQSGVAM